MAFRLGTDWDLVFDLQREDGSSIRIDASEWTFVLLRHLDGSHELLLKTHALPELSARERPIQQLPSAFHVE